MWIFIFWTPCMAKIAFYWLGLSILERSLPKCSTSERQNFSGDPIFWLSLYISFFPPKYVDFNFLDGHPVWLKKIFIGLFYPFLKKGSTNAPHHKGKTFQETQYFDHIHIFPFLHQNKAILHFLDILYG